MVALLAGTQAPDLSLTSTDGLRYSLYQRLQESPVVLLAFFKVSCSVCQFEFPYLERLHRCYYTMPIWAVSQDDADSTVAFAKRFGVTFPSLLDDGLAATVQYGLTNVPSLFLISRERSVIQTIVGFDKAELEKLNLELAVAQGVSAKPLFSTADEVPALRPG
jgi:peroxiredoxin